jgi:hypothetical protein
MVSEKYMAWMEQCFPAATIVRLDSYVIKAEAEFLKDDSVFQILRPGELRASLIKDTQEIFFEKTDEVCVPVIKLNHLDVICDMSTKCIAAVFAQEVENRHTAADERLIVLGAKNEEDANFIAWFLTLSEVVSELKSNPALIWELESLPIPDHTYTRDEIFTKALAETSAAEARIAYNAEQMLERIRKIRKDIASELAERPL